MKKFFLLFILFVIVYTGQTQTILYQDNLDSYPIGSFLAVENPQWWSTWSNQPGSSEDIQISNIGGHSGMQSGLADTIGGSTDALLLLGDKFTGAYELSWWMYIEPGKCGYYNIQHFEAPGTEYAMHIYFRANGTFELTTGGVTYFGTYPQGTWFEVKHFIDLDINYISLYIHNVFVHDWPFSYQVWYTWGTEQLGAVDFGAYAVTGSNEYPRFFIDDILFQELPDSPHPTISLDPTSINIGLLANTTGSDQMTVSNTGETHLTYDINIIYDPSKSGPDSPASAGVKTTSLSHSNSLPDDGGTDANAQLHYDGEHNISIGWSAPPVTVTVAAKFPNALTLPYAGMELKSVELYYDDLNSGPNNCTVRIFGMGNAGEPGVLLSTEAFVPEGDGWDTITLTSPVMVTGEDLWVGYTFTQTDPTIYVAGVDAGPLNPNGDFLNTGGGWNHLSDWPGFTYNWNIRANLEGTPIIQWLSASPMQDTVAPGNDIPVTLGFDATGLSVGQYTATLKYLSNDPENAQVDIPVTLDVVVGVDEKEATGVMIYPNPASDKLNIRSNAPVNSVTITDTEGRIMYEGKELVLDISRWADAPYYIRTVTDKGTSTIQFIKKK